MAAGRRNIREQPTGLPWQKVTEGNLAAPRALRCSAELPPRGAQLIQQDLSHPRPPLGFGRTAKLMNLGLFGGARVLHQVRSADLGRQNYRHFLVHN